jgi:hypothetical protein
MTSEPEVHFCNVCNQSIPETAVQCGNAVRVEGRIVPVASAGGGAGPIAPARGILVVAVLVVVAAVVAAALFVDARLGAVDRDLRADFAALGGPVARHTDMLAAIDRGVSAGLDSADLAPLRLALDDARELIRADVQELAAASAARGTRVDELLAAVRRLDEVLVQQGARLALVQDEVRALSRELAELSARPVPEARPARSEPGLAPPPPAAAAEPGGLPPELAHHAARLADTDDGARFEAVDQLLQSKDARVYPLILPLAKDPDLFVRRLVLQGIAEHRAAASVEALINALADPEEVVRDTAHDGLRRLTGEDIAFDARAAADQRAAMQRRWKQWWDKNRDGF